MNLLVLIEILPKNVPVRETEEISQVEQQGVTREPCWEAMQPCVVGYDRWGEENQSKISLLCEAGG